MLKAIYAVFTSAGPAISFFDSAFPFLRTDVKIMEFGFDLSVGSIKGPDPVSYGPGPKPPINIVKNMDWIMFFLRMNNII